MRSRHWVAVMVIVIAVCVGTAFAAELRGYVEAVDKEKGSLSLRSGKEIIEFEYAFGTLKTQVRKNDDVTVYYTDEAGKKRATKVIVHIGC